MVSGESVSRFGQFLEECEAGDAARVRLAGDGVSVTESGTSGVVELSFDVREDGPPAVGDVALDGDGALSLSLRTEAAALPTDTDGVNLEPRDVTFEPDGVVVTVEAFAPAAADGAESAIAMGEATPADRATGDASANDRSVPPFRDEELLARVYESCETFAEMADAIGMDVSSETVRRYMIDHGIHEPRTYDTSHSDDGATGGQAADGEGERSAGAESDAADGRAAATDDGDATARLVADGMGLPDSVTVEDVVDAVDGAQTIYEVGRTIGVDRMTALDLVQKLDLLECVMGRLSTETERSVGRDEIRERIMQSADSAA